MTPTYTLYSDGSGQSQIAIDLLTQHQIKIQVILGDCDPTHPCPRLETPSFIYDSLNSIRKFVRNPNHP